MSDQPRPVWLTREQRDDLSRIRSGYASILVLRAMEDIIAAWDAAPDDATEAAMRACWPEGWIAPDEEQYRKAALENAEAVLRALGFPEREAS